MKEMKLKVEYIPIDEIKPYENNAKIHTEQQIEQIKKSIEEFGMNDPIGIWSKDNIIIEGHGRLMACQELGLTEVPVIRLDDLTDEQRRAYTLIHNQTTMNTGFDLDILNEELKNIDLDMNEFGFENFTFTEEKIEFIEDDYEQELPKIPKTKTGQVYQLGKHRLMVGDSTKIKDVEKLMNGQKADLLYTDPPYNVNVSNSDGMTIENDNMDNESFKEFLNLAFMCASQSLKEGAPFYIWHSDSETINFRTQCEKNGLLVKQCLIWVKNGFNFGRQDYKWKHEPCLYGWKNGAGHYFIEEYNHSTVIEDEIDLDKMSKEQMKRMLEEMLSEPIPTTVIHEDKPLKNDLHPTMKPLQMCGNMIRNSSLKGEIVLDLFGGSGSTMMACEQLGRTCYMMEYDPQYADVIIDRWEQLTGNTAELISN